MDHKRDQRTPPLTRVNGVGRQQHHVCNRDVFGVVNVYHDHLKFCDVCINGRRYACCSESNGSNGCNGHYILLPSCVLSYTLFNIYNTDLTTTQSSGSTNDICRLHHHHIYTYKHECSQEIGLHTNIKNYLAKHNHLTLNPDKTTCTAFIPDPAEYKNNLDHKINNTALPMGTHQKVLGLTLHPNLSYSTQTSTNNKSTRSSQQDVVNRQRH